jgi:methylenetetrahydrofolate dehydrogenase (NADP+) / methenyltetrahydrofolate cyclohydrolase
VAEILRGKPVADRLKAQLRERIELLAGRGVVPGLALIRVGEDPASAVYVGAKQKACHKLGIASEVLHLPETASEADVLERIRETAGRREIDGLLVQLPLPGHLDENRVLEAIPPEKDVDGFHPHNVGLLALGTPRFVPATPLGILKIMEFYGIEPEGREVVILGRSRIVGRPLANLLSSKRPGGDATVTICHTRTRDLPGITRRAQILIVAAGVKRMVRADWVAAGATVIDVGIHREPHPDIPDKVRLCGDVDFDAVAAKVAAITPVPGGVGPMTVASLLANAVAAAERRA